MSGEAATVGVERPSLTQEEPMRILGGQILASQPFEFAIAAVILFNFILVILETDMGVQDEEPSGWMTAVGFVMLVVFCFELASRFFVHRCQFWYDGWHILDFCVVMIDLILLSLNSVLGDMPSMSVLRMLRLARLGRALKFLSLFPELRLMLAGLVGAARSVFFGIVLLFFAIIIWSIIAVQIIHPLNQQLTDEGVHEGCDRCPRAFASVLGATLTFTQQIVAGDSWGEVTIPIIEHFPASSIFFILVLLSVGLAILNLILAVIVNVATQTQSDIVSSDKAKIKLERQDAQNNLLTVCKDMDSDNSGQIAKEELFTGYDENPTFRTVLDAMEINREDLDVVWTILDSDRSGSISCAELVDGVYRMRESDSQTMLAFVKYHVMQMRQRMEDQVNDLKSFMSKELSEIKKEEVKIDEDILRQSSAHLEVVDKGVPDLEKADGIKESEPRSSLTGSCEDLLTKLTMSINDMRDQQTKFLESSPSRMGSSGSLQGHLPQLSVAGRPALVSQLSVWSCSDMVKGGQVEVN